MMIAAFLALIAATSAQQTDSIVNRATAAVKPLTDSVALRSAGYQPLAFGPVRDLTPFQGQHWLDPKAIVANLPVDLSKPTFVMYLPVRDSLIPVGVAYTRRIGPSTPIPTTLAGVNAEWHSHVFCRGVPGMGTVLSDGIDDCKTRGGTPTPQQLAMVHTWTIPNPDGPYAHDNPSLPYFATGLIPPTKPTRDDRLFGVALGEAYGAKLPIAHRIDRDAQQAGTGALLQEHRLALRSLVPQLLAAQKAHDAVKFMALRKKTISEWNALLSTYHALAATPEIGNRIDVELSEVTDNMQMHHH